MKKQSDTGRCLSRRGTNSFAKEEKWLWKFEAILLWRFCFHRCTPSSCRSCTKSCQSPTWTRYSMSTRPGRSLKNWLPIKIGIMNYQKSTWKDWISRTYCEGSLSWNPKITTPPALYLISMPFCGFERYANSVILFFATLAFCRYRRMFCRVSYLFKRHNYFN